MSTCEDEEIALGSCGGCWCWNCGTGTLSSRAPVGQWRKRRYQPFPRETLALGIACRWQRTGLAIKAARLRLGSRERMSLAAMRAGLRGKPDRVWAGKLSVGH